VRVEIGARIDVAVDAGDVQRKGRGERRERRDEATTEAIRMGSRVSSGRV
jgi:hypothetical protein